MPSHVRREILDGRALRDTVVGSIWRAVNRYDTPRATTHKGEATMADTPKSQNITWHGAEITQEQREAAVGQNGCVVWFTGLSGSGKSTVSRRVEQKLLNRGVYTYALDGDNVRHGLNSDLGFSPADRTEHPPHWCRRPAVWTADA